MASPSTNSSAISGRDEVIRRHRPPTMKEVAVLAGVDVSVVSRVINDDPRLSVAPGTRQRVLDSVQALGYRPNLAARTLRTARGHMLAFALPELTNPVYADIVQGAQRRAVERGYTVVLTTPHDVDRPLMDGNLSRGIDGVLVASGSMDSLVRGLREGQLPVVVVNRRVRGLISVTVDDSGAMETAVRHLLELGHSRIGVVTGPAELDTTIRRLKAFSRTMAEAGLSPGPVQHALELSAAHGHSAGRALISQHPEITAVLATTLMLGVGFLRAAHEHRVRVPRTISVIALHNAEIAEFTNPSLSTVALPMEEMGRVAADLLIDVIEGAAPAHKQVTTAPVLVPRESTAPPRAA